LLDSNGEPAALKSGVATSDRYPGQRVTLFTNAAGRFAAEGLAPGPWSISFGDIPPATYTFVIPGSATGLFDAETMQPDGAAHHEPIQVWTSTIISEAQ